MHKKQLDNKIIIYQTKSGAIELRGDFTRETIWASQAQIVDLFNVDQSVISRHINNIFKDREVEKNSNMQKMHIENSDKPITLYSLDVILGVGYRTNSKVAIEFRKWATKTLSDYIVDGYAINKNRIVKNYAQFLKSINQIKQLLPADSDINPQDVIELITLFTDTWLSLNAYDKGAFPKGKLTKKKVELTADKLINNLAKLKSELIYKSNATELFGVEKSKGSIAGIVGNIMQSFGDKELYPTIEEKAAHLLYFIVKNHPFTDGNKRSGAFAFIWF